MILLLAVFILRFGSIFYIVLSLFAFFDIWRGTLSWNEYGIGAIRLLCVGCIGYILMVVCAKMMRDTIKNLWPDLLE